MFEYRTGKGLKSVDVFYMSKSGVVEKRPEIYRIKGSGEDDGHWDVVYYKRQLTRLGREIVVGLAGGIPLGIIGYAIISTLK